MFQNGGRLSIPTTVDSSNFELAFLSLEVALKGLLPRIEVSLFLGWCRVCSFVCFVCSFLLIHNSP